MIVIWTLKVSDPKTKEISEHTLRKNPILLGRSSKMDLKLDNSKISSSHLSLHYKDSRIFIEDLKSTNGVYIYKKGEWKRIGDRIRARPPILINAGKVLNIVVKVQEGQEEQPEAVDTDLSRFDGLDTHSSFVQSIDEMETQEAILVIDLCQSSEMANSDDKMAFHMKKKLIEFCEWAFSQYKARFTKSTGDGYLATFEAPSSALFAAKQILQDIRQRNVRTNNPPIHIRVAIHVGKTYTIDDATKDIHGNDVNIAFRIEGVTPEDFDSPAIPLPLMDRILCSEDYRQNVASDESISSIFKFEIIGSARLKGIKDQKNIFLVST